VKVVKSPFASVAVETVPLLAFIVRVTLSACCAVPYATVVLVKTPVTSYVNFVIRSEPSDPDVPSVQAELGSEEKIAGLRRLALQLSRYDES
jgi:hypothetical protein